MSEKSIILFSNLHDKCELNSYNSLTHAEILKFQSPVKCLILEVLGRESNMFLVPPQASWQPWSPCSLSQGLFTGGGRGGGKITTTQTSTVSHNHFVTSNADYRLGEQNKYEEHRCLWVHVLGSYLQYTNRCTDLSQSNFRRILKLPLSLRSWLRESSIQRSLSLIVRMICSIRLGEADWSWHAQTQINR